MVFQDAGASLTPWLTVGEQVGEGLLRDRRSAAERRSRTSHEFQEVGLPADLLEAKPGRLSGGQLQRVALARATIVPPTLLLCDEPTSALDASLVASVLNILRDIRDKFDTTVIFVTHDLAIARVVADRIAVMYLGRIVEIGPTEQVISAPAHPYTNVLLASLPGLDANLPEHEGEIASPFDLPKGCAFHPRCAYASDQCRQEDPELAPLDTAAHAAACWHPIAEEAEGRMTLADPTRGSPASKFPLLRLRIVGPLVTVALIFAAALMAPLLAPHDPLLPAGDPFVAPSWEFLLGTDGIGRDLLSRVLLGMQSTLFAAVLVIASGIVIGAVVGPGRGHGRGVD